MRKFINTSNYFTLYKYLVWFKWSREPVFVLFHQQNIIKSLTLTVAILLQSLVHDIICRSFWSYYPSFLSIFRV